MKKIEGNFDITTGEDIITERDETAAEKKAREKAEADYALAQSQAKAKANARAALLSKLGITAEEAALLLS